MIGTNDIGYDVSQEETLSNIRGIIEIIKADFPMVEIKLMEILPVNTSPEFPKTVGLRSNHDIQRLNATYQNLAEDYFYVEFLPTYQAFLDEKGQMRSDFTSDGLHLTPAGYQVLAGIVQDSLHG